MDDDTLNQLQEALALSPDNAPLRRQIAKAMIRKGRHAEAEAMLRAGIAQGSGARLLEPALAEAFALQGKVSEALVILEQHANRSDVTGETLMLLCRTLLRNGDHDRARTAYRRAIDLDDKLADDDLADELGVDDTPDTPFGADDDVDELGRVRQSNQPHSAGLPIEMEKPGVDFNHVGGMDAVKDDIRVKIIEPIQHAEMYKAYGKA
ncbi:MAG: tetratricopeptide repeat protein, partial [Planctomycetota bacterium]